MKTIKFLVILSSILTSNLLFSQSKGELEIKVVKLEEELNRANKKLSDDKNSFKSDLLKANEEIDSLKRLFDITYEKFGFYSAFENKYSNKYFETTKFQKIGDAINLDIQNADLMIRFILMSDNEKNKRFKLAEKSRDFNLNWMVLDSITIHVLNKRYDSSEVHKAILRIENLPVLNQGFEMNNYKQKLKSLLDNYDSINCIASIEFKAMSGKMISLIEKGITLKDIQRNQKINTDRIATEYSYLHTVYEAIKSNPDNYEEEQYSLPKTCPTPKEPIIETVLNKDISENDTIVKAELKIDFDNAYFVDVRTVDEFSAGSYEGAVNIPLDLVESEIEKFKRRDQVVIFSNNMEDSEKAIRILKKQGVVNGVINGVNLFHLKKLKTAEIKN